MDCKTQLVLSYSVTNNGTSLIGIEDQKTKDLLPEGIEARADKIRANGHNVLAEYVKHEVAPGSYEPLEELLFSNGVKERIKNFLSEKGEDDVGVTIYADFSQGMF